MNRTRLGMIGRLIFPANIASYPTLSLASLSPPLWKRYDILRGNTAFGPQECDSMLPESAQVNLATTGIQTVFDPTSVRSSVSRISLLQASSKYLTSGKSLISFLQEPVPRNFRVEAQVARTKRSFMTSNTSVYIMTSEEDKCFNFLETTRQSRSISTSYTIGTRDSTGSLATLGFLSSSLSGSSYILISKEAPAVHQMAVLYAKSDNASVAPRSITVRKCVNPSKNIRPDELDMPSSRADLVTLKNKTPVYDKHLGAFVLKFDRKVSVPSIKNFQLVESSGAAHALEFGKTGSNSFSLDFTWPFSPVEAFACALSSFDFKLCCD